jgi:hypothetical protein
MKRAAWLLDKATHPLVGVYATPLIIAAGVYFAITGPDWWHDFFFDHALGFLVTAWMGAGFGFVWWHLEKTSNQMPGGKVTAALVGILGIFLVAGVALFTDPWFFGVAVWPGLRLLAGALDRHYAVRGTEPPAGSP